MATTIDRPSTGTDASVRPVRGAGTSRSRRPKQNFETWSWFFMRVSGLVLLFLALAHFAITHVINDVVETDANFVANRWENPLWRLNDWVLLALSITHGVNGVRWHVDDYVKPRGARAAVKALLYTVTGVLFAYGTFTIVTFGDTPVG